MINAPNPNPQEVNLKTHPLTRSDTSAPPIAILGVPFDNVTTAETVDLIELMVASDKPHYLATANVDFLVQAQEDVELRRILMDAHLVLCDGTPLLWASRLLGNPLPERVAGSDLTPLLIKIAAEKQYRIFFLGGSPESTSKAVEVLKVKYPNLPMAGHYSPPFAKLLEMDHEEIRRRVMAAQPDLLFVAFGCPKQEKWISMHYRSLGVPVCVGVGATIDFIAGTSRRAPKWMQKTGLEWTFRLGQEPRRLFKRYANDLFHFSIGILKQWWEMQKIAKNSTTASLITTQTQQVWQRVRLPKRVDIETVRRDTIACEEALANSRCCLLELDAVEFIDSTGMGLLIRLQKKARITGAHLVLVGPTKPVISALQLMKLLDFFTIAKDMKDALKLIAAPSSKSVDMHPSYFPSKSSLAWRGEVTAANAEEVWQGTLSYIQRASNQTLQIELSDLQFIDSAGVGLMIRARKFAREKGVNIRFVGMRPNVRNVLRIAKLETILLGEAA